MEEKYAQFLERVLSFMPKQRVYCDELRRLAWGTDAGFYRYVPKIVLRSKNEEEVSRILQVASDLDVPVTFRAAGTSLSGQSVTSSVLVVAGKNWEKYSISDGGDTITLQPGLVGGHVDKLLKPLGRYFTPDPASKNSAMVGGIAMNNASGMSCGTHANSDRELKSMRIVLADGTVLDTGDEASRESFRKTHPHFVQRIMELRSKVMGDAELVAKINYKYSIKNVTGLNIYSLVRFADPFDIIAHLMIGSEGTLGFASQFTFKTGHLCPYTASAMLYFASMRKACELVVELKKEGKPVECAELLDKKSLEAVNSTAGKGLTALLLRTAADTQEALDQNIASINEVIAHAELARPAKFTTDAAQCAKWWSLRSGIFPSVGGTRKLGTTVIIEDIAFHIEDLPDATMDLVSVLKKHGYDDCCIYGHVLEGNYHFIIAQSFDTKADVDRYAGLMKAIVALVVDKYHGSLKAEHGTGRNMAPFVSREWGDNAFEVMKEVKELFDPKGILNPGVIFNDDPECFIKNFKPMPMVNDYVDRCIECGFCEVNCLTCGFTLSSRQRIVSQREIARLRSTGENPALLEQLKKGYKYYGNETCAADGLCSTSCPMSISTGDLTHDVRAALRPKGSIDYKVGHYCARNLNTVRSGVKMALDVASAGHALLGDKGVTKVGEALHKAGLPLWTPSLPKARHPRKHTSAGSDKKVVYFPSCLNQTMGRSKGVKHDLIDEVVELMHKAGWDVVFPDEAKHLCCGMIWESKGMPDIADRKTAELEYELERASRGGEYPVVCDQSSCYERMVKNMKRIKPLELLEFIHDYVMPDLDFHTTAEPVALHLTCSTRLAGLNDKVLDLAQHCSTNVFVPDGVGCCGFAGDRGFNYPEVNKYALRKLRGQVEERGIKRGFSNNRTCEVGLTTNSGVPYQSLVYLINECTTSKEVVEQNAQ